MKALLIEWNQSSGKRAGNINPKDQSLRCNSWQNMDTTPALELRLIEDDRDTQQYKNIQGIIILNGIDQINAAIDANFPIKYTINDELIYGEHVKSEISKGKININKLPNDRNIRLKELKDKYKIKGILEIKPAKV